jgi:hypothetical protein
MPPAWRARWPTWRRSRRWAEPWIRARTCSRSARSFTSWRPGGPAFTGANAAHLLDAVLHADPPPLAAGGDGRLADLDVVLRRMLAKDPASRPPDMRAARQDLERLKRGESPRAVADTPAVAVLTFANITGNTEDDWLGTGIAETLTPDLRGVPGLALVPRGCWVLAGGFQRAGDAVRVTACWTWRPARPPTP